MSLAHLTYKTQQGDRHVFTADTGTNRFYRYRIGAARRKDANGTESVDEVSHTSALLRTPAGDPLFSTRFLLEIPVALFTKENRFVQLFSFRDEAGNSPAVSQVVAVQPLLSDPEGGLPLPPLGFSKSITAMQTPVIYSENKSLDYREVPVSRAMFWSAVIGALPKVLPSILPALGGLLGGGKAASGNNGSQNGAANGSQAGAISPELLKAVYELIQNLAAGNNGANTGSGSTGSGTVSQPQSIVANAFALNPELLTKLAPILEKVISPETVQAIGDQPVKLFQAIADAGLKFNEQEIKHLEKLIDRKDDTASEERIFTSMSLGNRLPALRRGVSEKYSTAKIAPALLAALPALAGVIEKVLDPKTIQAIGDQPVKLFQAIADAGLKFNEQEIKHLEKLIDRKDDIASEERIFMSMSFSGNGKSHAAMRFRYEPRVDLEFIENVTLPMQGRKKVVYAKGKNLYFPIRVKTKSNQPPKRTIPKAIVQLIVQDGETMKLLLEKRFPLREVHFGEEIPNLVLHPEESQHLPTGKDLKVEVSLIWQSSKDGKNVGTFKNHYVMLADEYLFDRMGDALQNALPLNDVAKHRAFWHKVWEGSFNKSNRWELALECKYYHALNTASAELGKLETRARKTSDNAGAEEGAPARLKVAVRLKSGMEWSIEALNALLATLSQPMLSPAQVLALKSEAMKPLYEQVARAQVEFRGRSNESVALWVFPEVMLHEFHLLKTGQVNEMGQVVSLTPEKVVFPHPGAVHFVGTKTE
jgi:hypothetical protein